MSEHNAIPEREAINNSILLLKRLRDEWSDEIPDEILNGASDNKLFKVRGNWYQGVTATAEELLLYAPKNTAQITEIRDLLSYFYSEDFSQKMASRTDQSDIDKGNRLISLVLELFR